MKKTKYITFSALLSALSVVVLLLGSVIDVLDLSLVILASLFLTVAMEEMGKKAISIYLVTLTLSFIVLPNKLIAFEYVLIGIYPVLKPLLDKIKKPLKTAVKLFYMVASSSALVLLMSFVFMIEEMWYFNLAFGVGVVLMLGLVDVMLFKFIMYYRFTLRHKLRIDKFFNQK